MSTIKPSEKEDWNSYVGSGASAMCIKSLPHISLQTVNEKYNSLAKKLLYMYRILNTEKKLIRKSKGNILTLNILLVLHKNVQHIKGFKFLA